MGGRDRDRSRDGGMMGRFDPFSGVESGIIVSTSLDRGAGSEEVELGIGGNRQSEYRLRSRIK